MKCMIISSNRWNSAITEYALSLGRGLQAHGHKIHMGLLANSPACARAKSYDLPYSEIPSFGITSIGEIAKLITREVPTHIVACGGPEEFLLSTFSKKNSLIRFRGQEFRPRSVLRNSLDRFQSRRTQAFIYPADHLMKVGVGIFGTSRPHISIPVGIDEKRFCAGNAMAPIDAKIVVFGRFDPIKGHRRFLQIYSLAKKIGVGGAFPTLHFVGEPANVSVADLKRWTAEVGLQPGVDVIISTERLADPRTLMNQTLIGAVSSLGSELICRVAEEFLMCGAPVFVSGAGSLNEVLFDQMAGWTYQGLADKQAALLLCKAVSVAMGESSQDRGRRAEQAQRSFSIPAMGNKISSFLGQLG